MRLSSLACCRHLSGPEEFLKGVGSDPVKALLCAGALTGQDSLLNREKSMIPHVSF